MSGRPPPRAGRHLAPVCYARGVRRRLAPWLLLASGLLPASASAEEPASRPRGVAVVAPGAPDEDLGRACRELAREVYRLDGLRPDLDEGSARALCGGDPGVEAGPKRVAELRQGLTPSLSGASSSVLALALADELGVSALVLVEPSGGSTTVRVVRVASVGGKPTLFLEPTRLDASPSGEPPVVAWATVGRAVGVLVEDEGEGASDGSAPPTVGLPSAEAGPGPRRDLLLGPRPAAPADAGDKAFYESPWFWVAAGSVAAVGIVVLVVSQTTDVGQGTVKLTGQVSP